MADILISHISFGPEKVEVGYAETRDRGETAMLFRTLVVDLATVNGEVDEVFDLIQAIVDKGLDAILNPPASIPVRQRPPY